MCISPSSVHCPGWQPPPLRVDNAPMIQKMFNSTQKTLETERERLADARDKAAYGRADTCVVRHLHITVVSFELKS